MWGKGVMCVWGGGGINVLDPMFLFLTVVQWKLYSEHFEEN